MNLIHKKSNTTSFIKSFCFLTLLLCSNFSSANYDIDSLKLAYDYAELTEKRIEIQLLIAGEFKHRREYDQAILEYQRALELIPKEQTFLRAETIEKLAKTYKSFEKIDKAKEGFKLSNDMYHQSKAAPDLIGRNYALLGRCYYDEAEYDSAMVYYLKSEQTYESNKIINREYGILFHFIGSVFKRQGDYDKACEYYNKEISYGKKHDFKDVEAEGMYLSGLCIESDTARLLNDLNCLTIYQELGNERMVGLMHQLVAGSYLALGNADSALIYQLSSLEVRRKHNEISHLAGILADIANTYVVLGNFKAALIHLKEAEEIALEAGIKKYIRLKDIYHIYYDLSTKKRDYKAAVDYLKLEYTYRDSARDTEHLNAIAEMELIYNTEKKETQLAILQKDKDLTEKEKLLAEESAAGEALFSKIMMVGVGILLLAAIFVYIKYRESQKQKTIISEQKLEMQFQKELVEAKNKDITDSMIYASSIQRAIITSEEYLSKMFNDFFVFYKPRDIVSGDFYWAYQTESGKRLIAVGDCTGHGVPGAMMSMLGNAFLNEIVIEGKMQQPNLILNRLRDQIKKALQNNVAKDGMDMSFCSIEKNKLTYCGANLPLYLLRKGELTEIKGNKQPIGYMPSGEKPFEQIEIDLESGDSIYLFTDGYADQFGGEKGKKYKYKTFRDKLVVVSALSFSKQKEVIETEFEEWKGDLEQLDDVCVLGFTV